MNSKYYQRLGQDCIINLGTIHLSSYGSHLVNKMVKLVVGRTYLMEDLKVQRVKNHKKTNHHNFECCRYFIKEKELFFLEFDADERFSNFIMCVVETLLFFFGRDGLYILCVSCILLYLVNRVEESLQSSSKKFSKRGRE